MVLVRFHDGFQGSVTVNDQTIRYGKGHVMPYDLTYSAIAGCLYSTFLRECEKEGLSVDHAELNVNGEKRTTVPTTVRKLDIHLLVSSKDPEDRLRDAFHEAMKHCSMVQTFLKVAEEVNAEIVVQTL